VFEDILTAFQQTTWYEMLAVIFSIAYTVLAAYENNWCWPAAIISVSIYICICFSAKLYSETGLQLFYLIMAFYGWWLWNTNKTTNQKLIISQIKLKAHIILILSGLLFTCVFYFIMKTYTDAALPLADAFVTAFSLTTTYMMTKKYIENWMWWIVIDGLSIYIFISRDLPLTALLYFIYVIIVVVAYFKWRGELQYQKA
jgi:nicotinamide mononucleotide transporter